MIGFNFDEVLIRMAVTTAFKYAFWQTEYTMNTDNEIDVTVSGRVVLVGTYDQVDGKLTYDLDYIRELVIKRALTYDATN